MCSRSKCYYFPIHSSTRYARQDLIFSNSKHSLTVHKRSLLMYSVHKPIRYTTVTDTSLSLYYSNKSKLQGNILLDTGVQIQNNSTHFTGVQVAIIISFIKEYHYMNTLWAQSLAMAGEDTEQVGVV